MEQTANQLLLSSVVLSLVIVVGHSCTISAQTSTGNYFYGGAPGMVDIAGRETVTVECQGSSASQTIRFNNSEVGVITYETRTLELTAETFKAGFYTCLCKDSVSKPLALTDIPQFAYSGPSLWTARQGDEVTLPCTITNELQGVTYSREWRRHSEGATHTVLRVGDKYSFSGELLMIRNISESDASAEYTCVVTELSMKEKNDLQGRRPSSGRMQIKLLHDVMPVLQIGSSMATCTTTDSAIDAQFCLTVTTTAGRVNRHCHTGSAWGVVLNAREVSCTVTQRANGSSSVISNQHSTSLVSEPIADVSNGDLQITSKMIREESTDQSTIEISFTLSQEGCHSNGGRLDQHVGKIIWTVSNGTAVNYTVVHSSSKQ